MGRRAKPAKVKAEARPTLAPKAPKQEAPGILDLEKRLAEALEQQAATAEILKVISSSPTDIQPVLDAVAESAARLCDAVDVVIRRVDGDVTRVVAHIGSVPARPDGAGRPLTERGISARAIRERRIIHLHDVTDPRVREEYPDTSFNFRTMLVAPLLREDTAVGAIIIRRPDVRPFSDKQIKLLETFAAQAAIAIENTRLFNETKEALEQQTATAEILRVISSSPTDIQPVLDAVASTAARLCGASDAVIMRIDNDVLRVSARHGSMPVLAAGEGISVNRDSAAGRAVVDRQTIHIHDFAAVDEAEFPVSRALAIKHGHRTILATPLLREGQPVGTILIRRLEARPFSDQQIKLLQTFADQAVIAIENVRLFNETKEALEQQTVISDILRVISSSPTDTQPVFDAIVKSGVHLFGGMNVGLRLVKGDHTELVASTIPLVHADERLPLPLNDDRMPFSRAILRREVVQIPDMLAAEEWVGARAKQRAEQRGFRAIMSAPMLRENNAIGSISVIRATPGRFTEKQIDLVRTFASQAVIAIENVRLFKELQARNAEVTEALEQQTATAEILKVISSSPTDIQPVFDAILENATRLCDAHMGILGLYDGETYHRVAQRGASAEFARWLAEEGPKYPPDASWHGQADDRRTATHTHPG